MPSPQFKNTHLVAGKVSKPAHSAAPSKNARANATDKFQRNGKLTASFC